jgi:glycosyltransferase involved in cell wall biosynthesis
MTDTNVLSDLEKSRLKIGLKNILLGKFLFKKTAVFLTSGRANKQFYRSYGVSEKKMVMLPFWWGYERILEKAQQLKLKRENLRKSFGIKKNDFILLFVGRLAKEKSPLSLLEAYSRVGLRDKKLYIVGDGSLRRRLEQRIKQLKLKEVYLIGFKPREDVCDFYTIADAFILPSRAEPWGMVVNEAMCFSLPVIVSDKVGAGVDLVKNGYNGFIFPAGNVKELTNCIERLINLSENERLIFGQRSLEMINEWVKKYDPVQQILKALKLIKSYKNEYS